MTLLSHPLKDFDLLNFIIPEKHNPRTDSMSKALLNDQKVVEVIVSTLTGQDAAGKHLPMQTDWINGERCDTLYCRDIPSSSLPLLVEYRSSIFHKYSTDPIILTLYIHPICSEYTDDFQGLDKSAYIKVLPSKYYATIY
ncbi:hypothetical protein BJV82DRAFT_398774 [Fennellomyces sp. T-0311]|nr:hypothetical protein BJV82DRAFT_398774 [Fennellomyces sp. T-0311]